MNKFLRFIAVVSMSLFTYTACTEVSNDVEDQILDLTDRVESLERLEDYVYSQIEALELLLDYSALGTGSISSVEHNEDGSVTLTFSDGNSTTVSVDLKSEYNPYNTQMRVENDYWQYSIDGVNWIDVKDANGNKVSSVDKGDSWFASAGVVDDEFVFTLIDGSTYSIPIVEGFSLIIVGADYATPVSFGYDETQTFNVVLDGASAAAIVAAPEGWAVSLANGVMSVTSPSPYSRSMEADSSADIALMAVSESGFAAVTKMKVEVDPNAVKNPTATITAQEATSYSDLTFSIALGQTTAWYYIFQSSDLPAPTVDALKATTERTDAGIVEITESDLAMGSSYTLYVLPVNVSDQGEVEGEIVSFTAKTKEMSQDELDYYEFGYTYAGVTYDKNSEGAVLIDAASGITTISKAGIYFIDGVDVTLNTGIVEAYAGDLVIIGRHAAERANVTCAVDSAADMSTSTTVNVIMSGDADGSVFIYKNINLTNVYLAGYGSNPIDIVIEDCYLEDRADKNSALYISSVQPVDFYCNNNLIRTMPKVQSDYMHGSTKNIKALYSAYTLAAIDQMDGFVVTNNTFYSSEFVTSYALFFIKKNESTTSNMNFNASNNAFYNIITSEVGLFAGRGIETMTITKNIFEVKDDWSSNDMDSQLSGMAQFMASTDAAIYPADFESRVNITDNIGYGADDDKTFWVDYLATTAHVTPAVKTPFARNDKGFETVDVANKVFKVTPSLTAEGYGPQE